LGRAWRFGSAKPPCAYAIISVAFSMVAGMFYAKAGILMAHYAVAITPYDLMTLFIFQTKPSTQHVRFVETYPLLLL
jgi:hypothetical protein